MEIKINSKYNIGDKVYLCDPHYISQILTWPEQYKYTVESIEITARKDEFDFGYQIVAIDDCYATEECFEPEEYLCKSIDEIREKAEAIFQKAIDTGDVTTAKEYAKLLDKKITVTTKIEVEDE